MRFHAGTSVVDIDTVLIESSSSFSSLSSLLTLSVESGVASSSDVDEDQIGCVVFECDDDDCLLYDATPT